MLRLISDWVRSRVRNYLEKNSTKALGLFDYSSFIHQMKKQKKGLMSKRQYFAVSKKLSNLAPCNLLVFGLGEDSFLWNKINSGGTTFFLEDSAEWIEKINDGSLMVRQVSYNTEVANHLDIGFDEDKLKLELPEEVRSIKYDFIIVDAPLGHQPPRPYKGPGRMSSIATASKLVKSGGTVVVDDMGRHVEKKYALHYFGKENLVQLVQKKVGIFEVKLR